MPRQWEKALMPRPKQGRQLISLYVSEDAVKKVDALVTPLGKTRSEFLRLAFKHGYTAAEAELKRNASG